MAFGTNAKNDSTATPAQVHSHDEPKPVDRFQEGMYISIKRVCVQHKGWDTLQNVYSMAKMYIHQLSQHLNI